jgi:hypothetical protein
MSIEVVVNFAVLALVIGVSTLIKGMRKLCDPTSEFKAWQKVCSRGDEALLFAADRRRGDLVKEIC